MQHQQEQVKAAVGSPRPSRAQTQVLGWGTRPLPPPQHVPPQRPLQERMQLRQSCCCGWGVPAWDLLMLGVQQRTRRSCCYEWGVQT